MQVQAKGWEVADGLELLRNKDLATELERVKLPSPLAGDGVSAGGRRSFSFLESFRFSLSKSSACTS